jgi:hypothetical protein
MKILNKELHKLKLKTTKKEDIPDVSNTIKPMTMKEFVQWELEIMRGANEQHKKLTESLSIDTTNTNEDIDYGTNELKE